MSLAWVSDPLRSSQIRRFGSQVRFYEGHHLGPAPGPPPGSHPGSPPGPPSEPPRITVVDSDIRSCFGCRVGGYGRERRKGNVWMKANSVMLHSVHSDHHPLLRCCSAASSEFVLVRADRKRVLASGSFPSSLPCFVDMRHKYASVRTSMGSNVSGLVSDIEIGIVTYSTTLFISVVLFNLRCLCVRVFKQ